MESNPSGGSTEEAPNDSIVNPESVSVTNQYN